MIRDPFPFHLKPPFFFIITPFFVVFNENKKSEFFQFASAKVPCRMAKKVSGGSKAFQASDSAGDI
jgi:hypothetical protein